MHNVLEAWILRGEVGGGWALEFPSFLGPVTWRTRAEVIGLRLEYCPDCHLAQISLRRNAGEHVLHCDGGLE